jgi:hypothetical protein
MSKARSIAESGAGEVRHGMGTASKASSRMTWPEIRESQEFRGRWVALDHCRYDAKTAQPVEGVVVDMDEDLVELCGRIQESDNKHCAILFCEEAPTVEPISSRPTPMPIPPRSYTTH